MDCWKFFRCGASIAYTRARTIEEYDQVVRLGDRDLALDASIGGGGSVSAPLVEGEGPFML